MTTWERVCADARELVERLIAVRSANPPGNEDRMVEVLLPALGDAGLEPMPLRLEDDRSSIVVRIAGETPGSLVLCGHLDTVNAEPEQWTSDPWTPRRDGDRLFGLGAADMKGGVAVLVAVMRELGRRAIRPGQDVVLVLTADEERGYRGAADIVERGLLDDARMLLIAEPTGGQPYIGQKGELWVECRFLGCAGHGSIPESGVNAVVPAAAFCLRLIEEARSFGEVEGRGRTSLNIGRIEGGTQVNIVPDRARVELDLRVGNEEERNRVLGLIEHVGRTMASSWGARFEHDVFNDRAPICDVVEDPAVARFLALHAQVTGRSQTRRIAPYSTDAVAIVSRLHVPVVIYGPGRIEDAHRPDEVLDLTSLDEAVKVIGRYAGLS